jgi:hypothetical protein
MMKSIYYLSKLIIALSCVFALFFAANFWLGSKEEWDKAIQEQLGELVLARLAFTLMIGFFFLLLSVFVDWLFRKSVQRSRTLFWRELLTIVFLSILFVGSSIWS